MNIAPAFIEQTRGFLDPDEGRRLYDVAIDAGRMGPCLEIGSYCGKSTLYLGAACRDQNTVLFAVDHHTGSEEQQPGEGYFDPSTYDYRFNRIDTFPLFRQTLFRAGLMDTVVPIVAPSALAARFWGTPLSLVFIDGGHSDAAAYGDYSVWAGHIMPGGFLLIHDIFENPQEGGQAPYHIYRMALSSGLFTELPRTKTLGVLRRRRPEEIPAFTLPF
jgi:predicted O-methyltransferase YrrM